MRLTSFSLLFIIGISASAQNSPSDYYVTSQADTVYGSLRVKASDYNDVQFKKDAGFFEALPQNATQFYDARSGTHYVKKEIEPGNVTFLAEKIRGPVSLYLTQKSYYMFKEDGSNIALAARSKLSIPEYGRELNKIKSFFTDCETSVDKEINALYSEAKELREVGITKLVNRYNACLDPSFRTVKPASRIKLEMLLLAKMGSLELGYTGDDLDYMVRTGSKRVNYFGPDFRLRFGLGALGLNLGVSTISLEMDGGETTLGTVGPYTYEFHYTSHTSMKWLELTCAVDYRIKLGKKFHIYPKLGLEIVKTDMQDTYGKREIIRESDSYVFSVDTERLSNDQLYNKVEPVIYTSIGAQYPIAGRVVAIVEVTNFFKKDFATRKDELVINTSRNNAIHLGLAYKF